MFGPRSLYNSEELVNRNQWSMIPKLAGAPLFHIQRRHNATARWIVMAKMVLEEHSNELDSIISSTWCDCCGKVDSLLKHKLSFCPRSKLVRKRHDSVLEALYDALLKHAKEPLFDVACDLPGRLRRLSKWHTKRYRPDLCFCFGSRPIIIELSVTCLLSRRANESHFSKAAKYGPAGFKSPDGQPCSLLYLEASAFGQLSPSCLELDKLLGVAGGRAARIAMQIAAVEGSKEIVRSIVSPDYTCNSRLVWSNSCTQVDQPRHRLF